MKSRFLKIIHVEPVSSTVGDYMKLLEDIPPRLLIDMEEQMAKVSEGVNALVAARDNSLDLIERLTLQTEFIRLHRHYDRLVMAWSYIQDMQFKLFEFLDFISEGEP